MEKAVLITETNDEITVQFNPAEYQITNNVKYSEKTIVGFDGDVSQFVSAGNSVLNLTLYFDTYIPPGINGSDEGGTNVALKTKQIVKLSEIDGSLHRPPHVTFSWGAINFQGVITDIKESYTMFLSDGIPVRAKLDLTLKSVFDNSNKTRQHPFESPDRTKYRKVMQGEYLWNYAYEEYDNPDKWKIIAAANNIKHPLDIRPGQMLRIPAI